MEKNLIEIVRKHFERKHPIDSGPMAWNTWMLGTFSNAEMDLLADAVSGPNGTEVMEALHREIARLDYLRITGGGDSFSMSLSETKPASLTLASSVIGSVLCRLTDPQALNK
jgi:hypothetical protein